MAISIDTVYQRVLALANKEQRGYITPQEFNLLAAKAQSDIFEQYFHDVKTAKLSPGNQSKSSDDENMLSDKILPHRVFDAAIDLGAPGGLTDSGVLPTGIHWLESVHHTDAVGLMVWEEVDRETWLYIQLSSKLLSDGVFFRNGTTISFLPEKSTNVALLCDYIKHPEKPEWGYVVVGDKALYNPSTSTDFKLHKSEESSLTNKILELAGIVINKPGLSEVILRNQAVKESKENR